MEKVVSFRNNNGNVLFGIMHIPEKNILSGNKIGINLLNSGIKYRVAPNRLNIKIARELCDLGYYVFRFDPSGIGDSEGEFPDGILVADIWEDIQTGKLVDDTLTANNFFRDHIGLDKLFLIGNCGGAITSLLVTEKDEEVDALCLIDVPINLRTANTSKADKITGEGEKSKWLFSEYLKRLFRLSSWYRFLTFKTDYRVLLKVTMGKIIKTVLKKNKGHKEIDFNQEYCHTHNLNLYFIDSLRKFVKRKKSVYFVLAGNDDGTEVFNKYIEPICPSNLYGEFVKTFCVKKANHIYTLIEWQESLINNIINWLLRQNKPQIETIKQLEKDNK